MTQQVLTISEICAKFSITRQQFDLATKIVDCNTNTAYYQVDSESTPGTAYNVKYNRQFGKLTCTCPAGERGITCKHKRSSLANEEYFKAEQAARREREQVTCLTDSNGLPFYRVDHYTIKYSSDHGKAVCTCPVGLKYTDCKHYRLAALQFEQAQVEATPEYQFEQTLVELENALDKLDEIAKEADERDARHAQVLSA